MTQKLFVLTFSLCLLYVLGGLAQAVFHQPQTVVEKPSPTEPAIEAPSTPIAEPDPWVIVIDPGHGPWVNLDEEPIAPGSSVTKRKYGIGAAGVITGTLEREINLNISLKVRDLLTQAGYTVIMTRVTHTEILSNIDRVNLANEAHADLMVRVHSDSYKDSSVQGASVLYPGKIGYAVDIADQSKAYAQIILDTLLKEVGMPRHGMYERTDQTGFNWSKVPIVTVEMGFLSNPDEDKLLSTHEYQMTLAQALFDGIQNCFEDADKKTN